MKISGLAIPFWTESEWLKAKATLPDGHTFHRTYGEFVALVRSKQAQLQAQGVPTVRVQIEVDALLDWCRNNGRQVNAQARSEFAALRLADQDRARAAE